MGDLSVIGEVLRIIESKTADGASVKPDTPLREIWLKLESVQVVELIVELEGRFGITLPDELLGHIDDDGITAATLAETIAGESNEQLT